MKAPWHFDFYTDQNLGAEPVQGRGPVVLDVVLRRRTEVAAGEEERWAQLEIYILQRDEGRIQAGFRVPEPV